MIFYRNEKRVSGSMLFRDLVGDLLIKFGMDLIYYYQICLHPITSLFVTNTTFSEFVNNRFVLISHIWSLSVLRENRKYNKKRCKEELSAKHYEVPSPKHKTVSVGCSRVPKAEQLDPPSSNATHE